MSEPYSLHSFFLLEGTSPTIESCPGRLKTMHSMLARLVLVQHLRIPKTSNYQAMIYCPLVMKNSCTATIKTLFLSREINPHLPPSIQHFLPTLNILPPMIPYEILFGTHLNRREPTESHLPLPRSSLVDPFLLQHPDPTPILSLQTFTILWVGHFSRS